MSGFRFHPSARAELAEAARYYRGESPRLSQQFVSEVRGTITRIMEFLQSGSPEASGIRRVVLDRFPFTLVYRFEQRTVVILAAMHQRQQPDYWRGR